MSKREKWKLIVPFVAPGLILFSLFTMYPAIRGLYISFFRWTGLTREMSFIGFDNYVEIWRKLTDPQDFYNLRLYLSHNLFLFIFSLFTIFLALVVASLINSKPRGYNLFRVTFFFPRVLSTAAIAILWTMILNPDWGLVNTILRTVGLGEYAIPWLSLNYDWPFFKVGLYSVGVIGMWAGLGWYMILFLSSIQNIPQELIESARIDGANRVRIFFSITIPLIWETIRTVSIWAVIGALNQFTLVFILFEQQARKHSDMIMSYYYWLAFSDHEWGEASALVVGVFGVTMIMSIATFRFTAREVVEY